MKYLNYSRWIKKVIFITTLSLLSLEVYGVEITTNYDSTQGLRVSWSGSKSSQDWIGIYRIDMTPGEAGSLKWVYTNCSTTVSTTIKEDGTCSISWNEPGNFHIHFFEDNGYKILTTDELSIPQVSDSNGFFVVKPYIQDASPNSIFILSISSCITQRSVPTPIKSNAGEALLNTFLLPIHHVCISA